MRKLLFGLLVVGFAAGQSVGQDNKDAVKVIEKAIEAHGGKDVLNKYKASRMKAKGNLSIMGQDIDFTQESTFDAPDKMKSVLELEVMGQKLPINQIVNGDKVKMTVNNMNLPVNDQQKEELSQVGYGMQIGRLTPLLEDKKFKLSLAGEEKVNGAEAVTVLVQYEGKKDVKASFDKKTGMMVKIERRAFDQMGQEVTEERVMTDPKKQPSGLVWPTKVEVKQDGKKFLTAEVVEYEPLDKVDGKTFEITD
jgi:hypothetical protein